MLHNMTLCNASSAILREPSSLLLDTPKKSSLCAFANHNSITQMDSSWVDSIRRFFGILIPTKIATSFYRCIVFISNRIFSWQLSGVKTWGRNSVALGNVSFLASDIDLTVLIHYQTPAGVEKLKKLLTIQKKWLPLFADTSVFFESDLEFISQHFNLIELARDPRLSEALKNRNLTPRRSAEEKKIEIFTFLLRMLTFDLRGIQEYPASRSKKWKSYFQLCSITPCSKISISKILTAASQVLNFTAEDSLSLEKLFQQISISPEAFKSMKNFAPLKAFPDWGMCIFPHIFCYSGLPLAELTQQQQQILHKQLQWEIVGLLSQQFLLEDKDRLPRHLENILKIIPENCHQAHIDIKEGVRLLRAIQ